MIIKNGMYKNAYNFLALMRFIFLWRRQDQDL
ncbi:hypothetical protein EMIT048CA2_10655 [Pseudomonas chlororaphis]